MGKVKNAAHDNIVDDWYGYSKPSTITGKPDLWPQLSTFKNVEECYARISPLVSKYHTREDDIRPLGNRHRKWEHIEKRDENCYVLHDTIYNKEHYKYRGGSRWAERPPITWERTDWTTEVVTIRGAVTPGGGDTTRYEFLRNFLPWSIRFSNNSGVHMVNGSHLPRPKNRNDEYDYFVQFTRMSTDPSGIWAFLGPDWPKPRKHVDKEMKAAIKDDISSFCEWMCSVGNLLPMGDWDYLQRIRSETAAYIAEQGIDSFRELGGIGIGRNMPPHVAIEVIKDFNHPLRTHLATNFLRHNNINDVRTAEDQKVFRKRFNTWANKAFGLITTVDK